MHGRPRAGKALRRRRPSFGCRSTRPVAVGRVLHGGARYSPVTIQPQCHRQRRTVTPASDLRAPARLEWGHLVAEAMTNTGEFRNQISRGIRKDVKIGIEQGHFDVAFSELLLTSLLAVVGTALREILQDPSNEQFPKSTAEMILRVLGVSPKEARALPDRVLTKFGRIDVDAGRRAKAS